MKRIVFIIAVAIAILVIAGSFLFRTNSNRFYDDAFWRGLNPSVSISPDDQYVVFAYNGDIFIAGIDGSDIKQMTFPRDEHHVSISPEFSPDGAHILFISYPNNFDGSRIRSSIFLMDINGKNLTQVTEEDRITWATFSADSNKIFFLGVADYGQSDAHNVYSISIDGTDHKQLTDLKAYSMGDLSVSADGKDLYFTQYDLKAVFYRLSLDGLTQMELLHSGEYATDYCLSPDKKYVVFVGVSEESRSKSPFEYELFVMDMATKQVRQMTTLHGKAAKPKFLHNQDKLLFFRALNWPTRHSLYELMTVDLDGAHLEKIKLPFESAA